MEGRPRDSLSGLEVGFGDGGGYWTLVLRLLGKQPVEVFSEACVDVVCGGAERGKKDPGTARLADKEVELCDKAEMRDVVGRWTRRKGEGRCRRLLYLRRDKRPGLQLFVIPALFPLSCRPYVQTKTEDPMGGFAGVSWDGVGWWWAVGAVKEGKRNLVCWRLIWRGTRRCGRGRDRGRGRARLEGWQLFCGPSSSFPRVV